MDISINLSNKNQKLLSKVNTLDIIRIGTEQIKFDDYVVFGKDMDETIPAVLLQLWRFNGGYDHAVVNLLENDLSVNSLVLSFTPTKYKARIMKITSYRSKEEPLSEKELYFYDVWPKETKTKPDNLFIIPFECEINIEDQKHTIVIPNWTPLQELPIERIKEGSLVEIWKVEGKYTLMRVLKL